MEKVDSAALSGTVSWLEDEYRGHRVAMGRLQQQVDQLGALVQQHAVELRVLEESIGGLRTQVSRLSKIEETLVQVNHVVAQLQDALAEQTQKAEKFERQYQVDIERMRQGNAELWQRIDLVQKDIEPFPVRILALSENYKKQQDAMIGMQQRVETINAGEKEATDRLELQAEQIRRATNEIERVEREIEPLRRQDEALAFRIQTVSDLAKRTDEQMTAVLAEERLRRDLAERMEVQRVQQERTIQEVVMLHQLLDGQADQMEEVGKHLKTLDDRAQAANGRAATLHEQILQVRGECLSRFADLQFLLDQQKRRLIAQAEQDLKDIKGFKIEPGDKQDA